MKRQTTQRGTVWVITEKRQKGKKVLEVQKKFSESGKGYPELRDQLSLSSYGTLVHSSVQ